MPTETTETEPPTAPRCPACQRHDGDLVPRGRDGRATVAVCKACGLSCCLSCFPLHARAHDPLTQALALLRDVAASAVTFEDPRVGYVELQVNPGTLAELKGFLKAVEQKERPRIMDDFSEPGPGEVSDAENEALARDVSDGGDP